MTCARTAPRRVTTRHTMTLIHGAATCTIAAYARVRGDRPRKERGGGRGGEKRRGTCRLSKAVRNSEREQRGVRVEAVSLLSLSLPLFFTLASVSFAFSCCCCIARGTPLARRISLRSKANTEGNTQPSRSSSFSERGGRVKINYERAREVTAPWPAIFTRR